MKARFNKSILVLTIGAVLVCSATGCATFKPPTTEEYAERTEQLEREGFKRTGSGSNGSSGLADLLVGVLSSFVP